MLSKPYIKKGSVKMNYKRYEIRAVFKQTKCKRLIEIDASNEEQAKKFAIEKGFIRPFKITEIPFSVSSQKQVH